MRDGGRAGGAWTGLAARARSFADWSGDDGREKRWVIEVACIDIEQLLRVLTLGPPPAVDAGPDLSSVSKIFETGLTLPGTEGLKMTMATEPKPASRPARRSKTATATQVGEHLSLTRQRVTALADVEHVLVRLADGRFDLDDCRHRYIEFLRNSRRSGQSAADAEFTKAKTRLLEVRMAEKLKQLVPVELLEDNIDTITALFRTELASLPAMYTRDIRERHRLEGFIREMLKRVSNAAFKEAERIEASEGIIIGKKETADADT